MASRSRAWRLGLGFAGILCGLARGASAQGGSEGGRGLSFVWRAPEGCPAASHVETEIDKLLGGPARDHARDELRVQATVDHGAGWLVTLETASKTANGHRTIEAATCQGLANATALIVALMIDPDAVAARSAQTKPADVPIPAPLPAAPPTLAPVVAPTTVPRGRTTFGFVGASAAGNLGVLPGPDAGASVTLGLVRPRWRIEARAVYGFRQVRSETLSNPPDAYGRFSFTAGTLSGCLSFAQPRMEWGPCVGAELGIVRGQGFGASQTTSESSPWFGLGAGAFLAIKAKGWLYFPVHADAVVPLWRPRYVFQNVPTPIFQSWPVGARLTAGVELRF